MRRATHLTPQMATVMWLMRLLARRSRPSSQNKRKPWRLRELRLLTRLKRRLRRR